MAYSKVTYTGNGASTDFAITFPYLEQSHIALTVNGVSTVFTWLNASLVRVSPAPANGATVQITRSSNRQTRVTDYQDASILTEKDMDFDALQLFFVAQEAFDAVADAPAGGDMRRSYNLADVWDINAARANIGAIAKTGDTMTGPLYLSGSPTSPNQASTKQYVDDLAASISALLGGGGPGMLGTDNTWTGKNIWTKLSAQGSFPSQFKSESGGIITDGDILLSANYSAAVDVRKVTNNATEHPGGGGTAGIYVQHKASGNNTSGTVNSAIRAQISSTQTRTGGVTNDVVGVYAGLYNNGADTGGFGLHADAYHAGSGGGISTYGVNSELFRTSSAGFTVGMHTRSVGALSYVDNDYAFLASPGGDNSKKFKSVFTAGSSWTGEMLCDYGLDLRHCPATVAAIAIQENTFLQFDVPGTSRMGFNPSTGVLEMQGNLGLIGYDKKVGFNMGNGCIFQYDGIAGSFGSWYVDAAGSMPAIMSVRSGSRTFAPSNPGTIANWLAIKVDGAFYHLPIYH
jgi:hypothetical protein